MKKSIDICIHTYTYIHIYIYVHIKSGGLTHLHLFVDDFLKSPILGGDPSADPVASRALQLDLLVMREVHPQPLLLLLV